MKYREVLTRTLLGTTGTSRAEINILLDAASHEPAMQAVLDRELSDEEAWTILDGAERIDRDAILITLKEAAKKAGGQTTGASS